MLQDMVRFTSVILAVEDLARARAFYDAVLGWPARIEAPVFVELGRDGAGIGLYLRAGFAANPGQAPAPVPATGVTATELYLHCDDVAGAIAAGLAAGGRLLSPLALRPWGEEVAYLADPDGNVVALARG